MLTAIAPTRNLVGLSPPPKDGPAALVRLPISPRVELVTPCQREVGGAFYRQRPSARLIAATLGSLLAHAGLMVFLGEPPRAANPEIPPRIALRWSELPLPSLEPMPPVPPPPALETSPPAPPAVSPPPAPLPPVAKASEPKFEPAPASRPRAEPKRAEPKRAAPKNASSVMPPRAQPKPSRPKTASVAPPPTLQPARSVASDARPVAANPPASRLPPASPPVEEPPLILDPRYRHPPKPPIYPASAIRLGQQGTVWVQARISVAGNVNDVRAHRTSGYAALDAAALAAVRGWAFVPASRDGRPQEAWVRVPVNFVLTENRRSFP